MTTESPPPAGSDPRVPLGTLPNTASRDRFAAALRGFGPIGILAILVIVMIGNSLIPGTAGLLVLAWMRKTGTPWREIGYVRPRSWIDAAIGGTVCGIAFKLLMKAIVMPLFGADPVNHAFHYLAGNTAALPGAVVLMVVGAGFGEETVYRGFLFQRLGRLLGSSPAARIAIVLITAVVFGAQHAWVQGWSGVEQAMITGLVFGAVMARTGSIVPLMFAHAAFDLTAVALIYANLETRVARLVFR